jgi:hypothetical protein
MSTPMPAHHRRTIAALVVALATAFAGGLWSMTLSPLEERAASRATAAAPPVEHVSTVPPHRLRLGATVSERGSAVANAAGVTWVLGPGTLSTLTDGTATVVSEGAWSGHAILAHANEGAAWIASGRFLWPVSTTGVIGTRIAPSVGPISAVLAADGRTWVAGSGGTLAWIDPYTGNTIQSYYLGRGTYQFAAVSGYVFVETSEPAGPAIVRLDPKLGATVPVPGASSGPMSGADGRVWWGAADGVQCVVAKTLRRCGRIDVATPAAVAARGGALWVAYPTTRGTDLALFDPRDGRPIADPVALPGSVVASMAVSDTTAWVGLGDAATVVQVTRS